MDDQYWDTLLDKEPVQPPKELLVEDADMEEAI